MSWELEHLKQPRLDRSAGSPAALVGFLLGLLAMSTDGMVFYWLYAPLATLAVTGVFALLSIFAGRHAARVATMADGALAATVFAMMFVLAGLVAVAN